MGLVPPTTPVPQCPVHNRFGRKREEGSSFLRESLLPKNLSILVKNAIFVGDKVKIVADTYGTA